MLGDAFLDVERENGEIWKVFYCEGCKYYHGFQLNQNIGLPFWNYNGDENNPSFEPEMLLYKDKKIVCHLIIRNGMIHYFNDSIHEFKNMTIPLSNA